MSIGNSSNTFIPPSEVAQAAKEGLAYRAKFRRGGTIVGIARGQQLSQREPLSVQDVRRIYSYFARHEVDKKGKNFENLERPSNGRIAWLLWGGEPGKEWVTKVRNSLVKENGRIKSKKS